MMRGLVLLFSVSFHAAVSLQAKDLGVRGPVFHVAEEDMLQQIHKKLDRMVTSGEMAKHQHHLSMRVKQRIKRPTPARVSKALSDETWLFDPSITVHKDLTDHRGKVFATKGTHINPLEWVSFGEPLLLFDGEDSDQIHWAKMQDKKAQNKKAHWVLTKGAPLELMQQESRLVFFDQFEMICRKFGLTHVPAKITQQDKYLRIEVFRVGQGR